MTHDDLHAAIAAYLRHHNPRIIAPCPPPVPLLTAPRCARCHQEITAEGEQFDVAILVAVRRCFDCFTAEAA